MDSSWGVISSPMGSGDQRHGLDLLFADGEPFDQVGTHFKSATWGLGHANLASCGYGDLRLDDVFRPVAPGSGDIARQRKIRQCRKSNVMRPANAALQHAATPYWDSPFLGRIMDGDRLAESPYPAELHIYDAAGFLLDRRQCVPAVANRLIETDGGLEA